ncbi:unnamed protein product [Periconia digitata]|uniref:Uncharacterized protein n=1 Tax=Periconia digitata TaxID=1303443 RepID=A0A9W4UDC3_9PLEO|nr:unnamed protein product [Periconia digitata]
MHVSLRHSISCIQCTHAAYKTPLRNHIESGSFYLSIVPCDGSGPYLFLFHSPTIQNTLFSHNANGYKHSKRTFTLALGLTLIGKSTLCSI